MQVLPKGPLGGEKFSADDKYWLDRISWLVATFFYMGYIPIVPGTAGALGGTVCYILVYLLFPGFVPTSGREWSWGYLIFLAIFFFIGTYVSKRVEKSCGIKDFPLIVVDEAFSIFITMFMLPLTAGSLIGGFILNRLFDIRKPFPASTLENIGGGWGIMLDDVVGAIYSNLSLRLILFLTR